jgi:hypothetical protein
MADKPPSEPAIDRTADNAKNQLDQKMVRWTRVVGTFTALLFVANVFGLFFIWLQYRVANESQIDTREQLRAVVTLNGEVVVITNDKAGNPTHYSVITNFYNFGGTRTAKFGAWHSVRYFEGKVPNNTDFTKPLDEVDVPGSVIGPNSPYQLPPVTFTQENVEKAIKNEGSIILWGHAEYSDIFAPEILHPISFCILLTPTKNTPSGQMTIQPTLYRSDCNSSK